MKKILLYISTIVLTLCVSGCAKFLDVNPKGETFDNDMFSNAMGYEDAIYGIYSEAANGEALYGGAMILVPEAMCQNFSCNDYHYSNMQVQKWDANYADAELIKIWENTYKCINHINNILFHIEKGGDNEFEFTPLYKGEMLGMRALLHFELLRLFSAPMWAPDDLKKTAIPYVKNYSFDITPFSTLDEAYQLVLTDLMEAEKCLEQDKTLITAERNNKAAGFTSCRITHMNLYGVQALIARVYWTMGLMDKAAEYAEKVIGSQKFSFRPAKAFVQPDNGTLDMNETIFGLFSQKYNTRNFQDFAPAAEFKGDFVLVSDWQSLYENDITGSGTDMRLSAWYDIPSETICKNVNKIFYDGNWEFNNYRGSSILGPSIIRLPELYFIVAEAYMESDPQKARKYFDEVIKSRGLETLEENDVLLDQDRLFRERRKEFYAEGITWYDMKKFKMDVHTVIGTTLEGDLPGTYTLKIPDEEFEGRDNINK